MSCRKLWSSKTEMKRKLEVELVLNEVLRIIQIIFLSFSFLHMLIHDIEFKRKSKYKEI